LKKLIEFYDYMGAKLKQKNPVLSAGFFKGDLLLNSLL